MIITRHQESYKKGTILSLAGSKDIAKLKFLHSIIHWKVKDGGLLGGVRLRTPFSKRKHTVTFYMYHFLKPELAKTLQYKKQRNYITKSKQILKIWIFLFATGPQYLKY